MSMAANPSKVVPSISKGKTALACFYHKVTAKKGTRKAIVAECRQLAIIFYNTLTRGIPFIEEEKERYSKRLLEREKALLRKLAKKHKLTLVIAKQESNL